MADIDIFLTTISVVGLIVFVVKLYSILTVTEPVLISSPLVKASYVGTQVQIKFTFDRSKGLRYLIDIGTNDACYEKIPANIIAKAKTVVFVSGNEVFMFKLRKNRVDRCCMFTQPYQDSNIIFMESVNSNHGTILVRDFGRNHKVYVHIDKYLDL